MVCWVCFNFKTFWPFLILQFVNDVVHLPDFAAGIVWLDFTKFGTVANNDLNESLELMELVLKRLPQSTCGFVICPHLLSEKSSGNGIRGEIRHMSLFLGEVMGYLLTWKIIIIFC